MKIDYAEKFEKLSQYSLYRKLRPEDRRFIKGASFKYLFTRQQFEYITKAAKDLELWQATPIKALWEEVEILSESKTRNQRKSLFNEFRKRFEAIKRELPSYTEIPQEDSQRQKLKIAVKKSDKTIYGPCPVASEKTVCCNLKTLDIVENCGFGCSYCTIQTFYGDQITFDKDLGTKLREIDLDPNKLYHIGTGQSSDALMWGNRYGILDDLMDFAKMHPNVLLELKTKSSNISYFLSNPIPSNVVLSWSLNTDAVISNEEHYTASLEQRLKAAEKVSCRGIKIAFHFHPIVLYDRWKEEYKELAQSLIKRISPDSVAFVSMGTLTFIKPVIRQIRERGIPTQVLKADMAKDPHNKSTYTDDIKLELFTTVYGYFKPWHRKVYFYLCMEKREIWERVFGWCYSDNDSFERDLIEQSGMIGGIGAYSESVAP